MVIKKLTNGNSKVDWVKSLIVLTVFSGLILYCMKLSVEANNNSRVSANSINNIEKRLDRVEDKLDKILEKVK